MFGVPLRVLNNNNNKKRLLWWTAVCLLVSIGVRADPKPFKGSVRTPPSRSRAADSASTFGRAAVERFVVTFQRGQKEHAKRHKDWPKTAVVQSHAVANNNDRGEAETRSVVHMEARDVLAMQTLADTRGTGILSVEPDLPVRSHGDNSVSATDLVLALTTGGLAPPSVDWQYNSNETYSAWHSTLSDAQQQQQRVSNLPKTIAVLDTGLPCAPALRQMLPPNIARVPGYDFVSDPLLSVDGDGRDSDPTDLGDAGPTCPTSSWHGLQMASTAFAASQSNQNISIQNVRVLGKCGQGFASDLADAISWASTNSSTVPGVSVVNSAPSNILLLALSGAGACPSYVQASIDAANQAGAVVIVAAGNDASDISSFFPANCAGVVSVGGTTRLGDLAWYSNTGAGVALAGGDETYPLRGVSIDPGTGGATAIGVIGTSFSAAILAGLLSIRSVDSSTLSYFLMTPFSNQSTRCALSMPACSKTGITSVVTMPNALDGTLPSIQNISWLNAANFVLDLQTASNNGTGALTGPLFSSRLIINPPNPYYSVQTAGVVCLAGQYPNGYVLPVTTSTRVILTVGNSDPLKGTGPTAIPSSYQSAWNIRIGGTLNGYAVPPGVQLWTVPATNTYMFVAAGAAGGASPSRLGGFGVVVSNVYALVQNQVVAVIVGQTPSAPSGTLHGHGGGGTFISIYAGTGAFSLKAQHKILLVAGGGGGGGVPTNGMNAQQGQYAGLCNHPTYCYGPPAILGGGGGACGYAGGQAAAPPGQDITPCGCGGGGVYYNGAGDPVGGGNSFLTGGAGGIDNMNGAIGGFGGGGAGTMGGGGGGGVSGGQGGAWGPQYSGGGGGASYDYTDTFMGGDAILFSIWDTTRLGAAPSTYAAGYNNGPGFAYIVPVGNACSACPAGKTSVPGASACA